MTIFEEIKQKQLELQKMMEARGQEALKEYFEEIFAADPELKKIRWVQYTPYFNDGEPCVFSIGEPEFNFGEESDDDEYDGYSYGEAEGWTTAWGMEWKARQHHGIDHKEFNALSDEQKAELLGPRTNLMRQIEGDLNTNEKVFEMVFNDHVQVTATPDGFEVEEYYHD